MFLTQWQQALPKFNLILIYQLLANKKMKETDILDQIALILCHMTIKTRAVLLVRSWLHVVFQSQEYHSIP
jgi:hypothetical protein